MAFLVDWIHTLISLVLLLALAELLLPDGSMRPYVRVILGVVLVVAVLRPLVQLGAFQWRLPALTVPPPSAAEPLARGERLAAVLQDRARQEAEAQVALQAARLLELRAGVTPRAVTVSLNPEGWVERIQVVLGDGRGGRREPPPAGRAPEATIGFQVGPVQPVTVAAIRVGEAGQAPEAAGVEQEVAAALALPDDEPSRRVRALLAEFYQVPADRVQVRP